MLSNRCSNTCSNTCSEHLLNTDGRTDGLTLEVTNLGGNISLSSPAKAQK